MRSTNHLATGGNYTNFNNCLIYTMSEIDPIIHLNENYNRNFFSVFYIINKCKFVFVHTTKAHRVVQSETFVIVG